MRLRRVVWLLLPLGWLMACGGRFEKTVGGDDQADGGSTSGIGATSSIGGTSAGKAGSSSRAGSSSKAGGSSRGGSGRGGNTGRAGSTSIGGTTSVAGSVGTGATGGVCLCLDPGCIPPLRAVPNAGSCCDHCEADLMECAAAEQSYQTYRDQVIQKYQTLSCTSDSDCGLLFNKNECGVIGCGAPMLNSQIMVVMQMLDAYAQANCSFLCPQPPVPGCPLIPTPKCVMNRCQ